MDRKGKDRWYCLWRTEERIGGIIHGNWYMDRLSASYYCLIASFVVHWVRLYIFMREKGVLLLGFDILNLSINQVQTTKPDTSKTILDDVRIELEQYFSTCKSIPLAEACATGCAARTIFEYKAVLLLLGFEILYHSINQLKTTKPNNSNTKLGDVRIGTW